MKHPLDFFCVWLLVTVLYCILSFFELGGLPFVLGLFVPYGILGSFGAYMAIGSGNPFALVPPVLLLVSFFVAHSVASRLGITTVWARIAFNLSWLLVLTLITDLMTYGTWMSFIILMNGGDLNI